MKIAVGMSGGVDSSAAAKILRDNGDEVLGVTLKLTGLPAEDAAVKDAKSVCERLGIRHMVLDLRERFEKEVKHYFREEYRAGRTPNPCVRCNKYIKFGEMMRVCLELGYENIATGHYAEKQLLEGKWYVKASDNAKDQSYMLWMLDQKQLKHTVFPIAGRDKQELRNILMDAGIEIYSKKDSQDICFIPDGDYIGYLRQCGFDDRQGVIIDNTGRIVGRHSGYYKYTLGQRKGLGGGFSAPVFVTSICAKENRVTIGPNEELFSISCRCDNCVFTRDIGIGESFSGEVKIRYSAKKTQAVITRTSQNSMTVRFSEPQRAVTPGQSAVVYDNDLVICGGEISCGGKDE